MAIRNILKIGDETLYKKSREVADIDKRILTLLDDMAETLNNANGVGLAAPQVGVLKRVVVIDVGEGIIELINPKITYTSDEMINDYEGCLSVPERYGYVERPQKVTVSAINRNGKQFEVSGEGLLARAFCHELDHLDGHLFTEKVTEYIDTESEDNK